MSMRFLAYIGFLHSLVSSAAAQTQATPESLAIAIEKPNAQTIGCEVTEGDIRATIRSAMRYNRILEDAESSALVYVSFQGYRVTPEICAGTYRLAIIKGGITELDGTMRSTANTFCEQSYLLSGPNLVRYREQMRRDFEACLSSMQDRIRS